MKPALMAVAAKIRADERPTPLDVGAMMLESGCGLAETRALVHRYRDALDEPSATGEQSAADLLRTFRLE
jgi:hypothetical protein